MNTKNIEKHKEEINMKKFLTMFVVLMMLGTLCACSASTQRTEDKEKICKALTDIQDWNETDRLMEETVNLYRDKKALQYVPHGVYNLEGYNMKTYKFAEPNNFYEVVAFDDEADHVMVIHNTGDHGISFWSGIYKGGEFTGMTENYILYTENDNIMAVSILEREDCKIGEYVYDVIPFDELPRQEQDTAVFPCEITNHQF